MPIEGGHSTDEQLLLLQDGELTGLTARRVRRHLDGCSLCRTRAEKLDLSIGELSARYRANLAVIPDDPGSRALLKARLGAAVPVKPAAGFRWSLATAALLVVGLGGAGLVQHERGRSSAPQTALLDELQEPDRLLTPGAVRNVSLSDICSNDDDRAGQEDDQDPVVTPTVQQTVFREYGMDQAPPRKYQVDYLISPQLGGTNEIRNLWPQPYSAKVWNAQAKDALEGRLHQMVCERQIDLASAQHDIATDWISAYKRVFHTAEPR